MKTLILIVLSFNIYLVSNSQTNNEISNDTISKYDVWNYGITFTVQVGIWLPIGNLNNTFNSSPNIGLKFGFPLTNKLRFDLGTSIYWIIRLKPCHLFR